MQHSYLNAYTCTHTCNLYTTAAVIWSHRPLNKGCKYHVEHSSAQQLLPGTAASVDSQSSTPEPSSAGHTLNSTFLLAERYPPLIHTLVSLSLPLPPKGSVALKTLDLSTPIGPHPSPPPTHTHTHTHTHRHKIQGIDL